MSKIPVISIVQRRLTHYRVPFFIALREHLERFGCSLQLLHGEGTDTEILKKDSGHIEWAKHLPTNYFFNGGLCWQPFNNYVKGSSLVIITHENAMLANQLALFCKSDYKLALWGHGANLQGDPGSFREKYKRLSARRADWYFAYTSLSVDLLSAAGFPRSRTTQLDNAIDVAGLKSDLAALDAKEIARIRADFGLNEGPVALYLGSLYEHKRLDVLIAAAERLRYIVDGFQLLIVGDGPQRMAVETASAQHHWIKYVGARNGRDKAGALRIASIIMNPGLVGLGILDSFAGGVPMVTTDCGLHSPEIAYLSADNGIMTSNDLNSFVSACARLLTDESQRKLLSAGCKFSSNRYTLTNMVENFTHGVLHALDSTS